MSPGTSEDEIVLSGDTGLAVSVNGDGSSGDDTSRASTESAVRFIFLFVIIVVCCFVDFSRFKKKKENLIKI